MNQQNGSHPGVEVDGLPYGMAPEPLQAAARG